MGRPTLGSGRRAPAARAKLPQSRERSIAIVRHAPSSSDPPVSKTCATCDRPFADRGKWRRRGVWDEVRYCSKGCRAGTVRPPRSPSARARVLADRGWGRTSLPFSSMLY
ncbi:MAG: DUF2256 domain-containing protein [Trueperaceae bacterium]